MSNQKIGWGIMGPGAISRKFAEDLLGSKNAELTAVVSRSRDKAEQFARDFQIPHVYDEYEAFVQDENIDIVYIGTLHPMHREGMLLCLRAGKAVLCEKPFTMNAKEAEEVIKVARDNDTFVMEAMWTRFLPPIAETRKWLAEGQIGEVKMVTANFGFHAGWNPNSRVLDKRLGGGALLDAGIYPVSFASMVFGKQPERISSHAYIGKTGVDEYFSALFEYEGGQQTALLTAGVQLKQSNDAFIYGSKGYIHLPEFLFSRTAYLHRQDEVVIEFNNDRQARGMIFEAEEAMACLREGRKESKIMPLDETHEIMQTLDALREQWGLEYEDTVK